MIYYCLIVGGLSFSVTMESVEQPNNMMMLHFITPFQVNLKETF